MNPQPTLLKYFDNPSTSYPKTEACCQVLSDYYREPVGSYGRSIDANSLKRAIEIEQLRNRMAQLLGVSRPQNIVFTDNATTAINTVLQSIPFQEGDIVWVSPMEHNAVARPLERLHLRKGIALRIMPALPDGTIDLKALKEFHTLDNHPALCIVNLESNVNGMQQPLADLSTLISQEWGIPMLADSTQYLTPGCLLEAEEWGLEYVAFSGHKGLLGPMGTGGLYMRSPLTVEPLTLGGNGMLLNEITEENVAQHFMAGTPNMPGLCALYASVCNLPEYRVSTIEWISFIDQLSALSPELHLYRSSDKERQGYLCSLTHNRISPSELCSELYYGYELITRAGIHCAPMAHEHLGTAPSGALRLGISPYHTHHDLEFFLSALHSIVR